MVAARRSGGGATLATLTGVFFRTSCLRISLNSSAIFLSMVWKRSGGGFGLRRGLGVRLAVRTGGFAFGLGFGLGFTLGLGWGFGLGFALGTTSACFFGTGTGSGAKAGGGGGGLSFALGLGFGLGFALGGSGSGCLASGSITTASTWTTWSGEVSDQNRLGNPIRAITITDRCKHSEMIDALRMAHLFRAFCSSPLGITVISATRLKPARFRVPIKCITSP